MHCKFLKWKLHECIKPSSGRDMRDMQLSFSFLVLNGQDLDFIKIYGFLAGKVVVVVFLSVCLSVCLFCSSTWIPLRNENIYI